MVTHSLLCSLLTYVSKQLFACFDSGMPSAMTPTTFAAIVALPVDYGDSLILDNL